MLAGVPPQRAAVQAQRQPAQGELGAGAAEVHGGAAAAEGSRIGQGGGLAQPGQQLAQVQFWSGQRTADGRSVRARRQLQGARQLGPEGVQGELFSAEPLLGGFDAQRGPRGELQRSLRQLGALQPGLQLGGGQHQQGLGAVEAALGLEQQPRVEIPLDQRQVSLQLELLDLPVFQRLVRS